jgi:SAM-dependent methyltransferase
LNRAWRAFRRGVVRLTWNRLARRNPTYAILTDPSRARHGWDHDEFRQIGRSEVEAIFAKLETFGIRPDPRLGVDYGCGIGRCAEWLAPRFDSFIGVDLSAEMLSLARQRLDPRIRLMDPAAFARKVSGVTFLYSRLVLQHNPPSIMEEMVRDWIRALAPGGVLVFQIPVVEGRTGLPGPLRHAWSFLLFLAGRNPRFMEMHGIRRERLDALLSQGKLDIAGDLRDGAAGASASSHTLVCLKRTC